MSSVQTVGQFVEFVEAVDTSISGAAGKLEDFC